MNKDIIKRIFFLIALFYLNHIVPYNIEMTDKASLNIYNPQESKWNFELWNKTNSVISVLLTYDEIGKDTIRFFTLSPQKKVRLDIFVSIPFYIYIGKESSNQKELMNYYTLKKKIKTQEKTVYVAYEKKWNKYILRPQKGDGVKTKSGLSIINNVLSNQITHY